MFKKISLKNILIFLLIEGMFTVCAAKVLKCNGPFLHDLLKTSESKELNTGILRVITYPEQWNCAIKPNAQNNQPKFVAVKKKMTYDVMDVISFIIVSADGEVMFGGTVYPEEEYAKPMHGIWYVDKYGNNDLTPVKADFRDTALKMFRELAD